MKVVKIGSRYEIYQDSLKTYDQLPAKTYTVVFDKMAGFFLEEHAPLVVSEKLYGSHDEKVNKVLRSFRAFERNLGVILSGDKGIGKSIFAKRLCEMAVESGLPVLVVNKFIPGIASYLEAIDQECVILFDEFDKTFGDVKTGDNEASPQAGLLTLFDGTAVGKKLFVVTCNDLYKMNDYMVNRPGRFHYNFRFDYPSADEIREYMGDKLDGKYTGEVEKIVRFSKRVRLNYDCLRAIAFELNNGESFESAIQDLNIVNYGNTCYDLVARFHGGTMLKRSGIKLDLFNDTYPITLEMENNQGDEICDVQFNLLNMVFDELHGVMFIPGENCKITYWDKDAPETLKQDKVETLTIKHAEGRKYHYNLTV